MTSAVARGLLASLLRKLNQRNAAETVTPNRIHGSSEMTSSSEKKNKKENKRIKDEQTKKKQKKIDSSRSLNHRPIRRGWSERTTLDEWIWSCSILSCVGSG